MSIQATKWAWKVSVSGAEKLVLVAIADFAGDDGIAWPTNEQLMEMTGASERSVRAARKGLSEKGVMETHVDGKKWKVRLRLEAAEFDTKTAKSAGLKSAKSATKSANIAKKSAKSAKPSNNHQVTTKEPLNNPLTPFAEKSTLPSVASLPEWLPRDAWDGWIEMRRRAKKPPTDRAVALTLRELDAMRAQGQDVAAVLDQSTQRGWIGVFPVKNAQAGSHGRPHANPVRGRTDFSDLVKNFDEPITNDMEPWEREALRKAGYAS